MKEMKLFQILETLVESENGVKDEAIMALKGKSIEIKGVKYTISKIEHNGSFGQNYSFFINDMPAKKHQYGSRAFVKDFDKLLPTGKECAWSENGMQGEGFVNFDIVNSKPSKKVDVAAGLERCKEFLESKKFEIIKTGENYIVGKRRGKGEIGFVFRKESEDREKAPHWACTKGMSTLVTGDLDYVIKSLTTGYSKRYV